MMPLLTMLFMMNAIPQQQSLCSQIRQFSYTVMLGRQTGVTKEAALQNIPVGSQPTEIFTAIVNSVYDTPQVVATDVELSAQMFSNRMGMVCSNNSP